MTPNIKSIDQTMRAILGPYLAVVLAFSAMSSAQDVGVRDFLDQAEKLLPVEERYDYHESFLAGSMHTNHRSAAARAASDEIAFDEGDWSLVLSSQCGPLTRYGCYDTREYFELGMKIKINMIEAASLGDWSSKSRTIVAGTRDELAELKTKGAALGGSLVRSKDYEIRIDNGQVIVCGWDDAAVMHGLFHLQSRMNLREGPFLPREMELVRHSRFQTRMVMSWLGWMQFPDKYLAHLAHDGYDAIYASVYANPNGVEGPPHYDLIRKQDPKRLQDLIDRAEKFGLRVYAAIMYASTEEADNESRLRAHVRDIVTRFPKIRGYILLTEGFMFGEFRGAFARDEANLRKWAENWTKAVAIVSDECHRIDSSIEVIPWEYNVDFRPERAPLKREIIAMLPKDSIPMLTWENGKAFEIDGYRGFLRDYSINQVGPAEAAQSQIAAAKERGMKCYTKADCYATWQFGTTPYIPAPQQWQKRYTKLADYEVDGTLESWSNGYKPNFVANLRCWSAWSNAIADDELLRLEAKRLFGEESVSEVIAAWEHFSKAIQLVPDTGPSMGTNNAVAHPLFLQKPPPRLMTMHNSWWDEDKKTPWRFKMEEAWPYCHRMMVFMPDFTNRKNQAELYARARSGIENAPVSDKVLTVFRKYLKSAASEFETGLRHYRRAALAAPESKRSAAFKEVLIVEQLRRMLLSLDTILGFEESRLSFHAAESLVEKHQGLQKLGEMLQDELARTEESYRTAQLDSRLGYQLEMDYVYTPFVIDQKRQQLQQTLDIDLPKLHESIATK